MADGLGFDTEEEIKLTIASIQHHNKVEVTANVRVERNYIKPPKWSEYNDLFNQA